MISRKEFDSISDERERREIAMYYMHLRGIMLIKDISLDVCKALYNTAIHVREQLNLEGMSDDYAYGLIETGDRSYEGMMELRKRENRRLAEELAKKESQERMTKEQMMSRYYLKAETPANQERNYQEAQRRIRVAMEEGEKYVYLPGKNNENEFNWVATSETIGRLRADGFDIDRHWAPYEYWSIEWGY